MCVSRLDDASHPSIYGEADTHLVPHPSFAPDLMVGSTGAGPAAAPLKPPFLNCCRGIKHLFFCLLAPHGTLFHADVSVNQPPCPRSTPYRRWLLHVSPPHRKSRSFLGRMAASSAQYLISSSLKCYNRTTSSSCLLFPSKVKKYHSKGCN